MNLIPINIAFSAVQTRALRKVYHTYRLNRKHMEIMTAIQYLSILRERPNVSITDIAEIMGHNHATKQITRHRIAWLTEQYVLEESRRGKFEYWGLTTKGLAILEYYQEFFFTFLSGAELKCHNRLLYGYLPPAPEEYLPIIPPNIFKI